jgi:hypothetical protein
MKESNMNSRSFSWRLVMCLTFVIQCVSASSALAASMLESAPAEHKKLFEEAKQLILKNGRKMPAPLIESDQNYFWVAEEKLKSLVSAYRYSKDPEFLEVFVPLMERYLSQRYIHPNKPEWNGWWDYKDAKGSYALIDHDAILYFVPALMFVEEVKNDASLKEKYGAKAEAWLKDIEVSIRAWDQRGCWHDFDEKTGWYSVGMEYPDKDGNLQKNMSIFPGGTYAYNKVNDFILSLVLAYRLTGDEWYRVRMEKCAAFWRDHWRDDGSHVEWNYRDHALPGDYESGVVGQGKPKTGAWVHPNSLYYEVDVRTATALYDAGIFFQKPDLEKLIKTHLELMWRKDTPPTFTNINGKDGRNKNGFLWTSLAHFDPRVRNLWKESINNPQRTWTWQKSVVEYLIEMTYPVSWQPRDAGEIPRKQK